MRFFYPVNMQILFQGFEILIKMLNTKIFVNFKKSKFIEQNCDGYLA